MIPAVEIIIACLLAIYYRKYGSSRKIAAMVFRAFCRFSFLLVHSRRFYLASSFYCSSFGYQFRPDLARARLFFQRSKEVKNDSFLLETGMAETFIVLLPIVGFSIVYQWIEYKMRQHTVLQPSMTVPVENLDV